MKSYVALAEKALFKSRYGKWYLINTKHPDERILVEDYNTVQVLLRLFQGVSVREAEYLFGLRSDELITFLNALMEEKVIASFDEPRNSLNRCFKTEPPLDSVNILITNECNLNCVHCCYGSGKKITGELSGKEWISVLEQVRQLGCFGLNVSGGEPLLHKDFSDIAEYISTVTTFCANLNTNGTQLCDDVEKLLAGAFNSVQVSIDSSLSSEHDSFRGSKGCFQKTVRSVEKLIAAGIKTNVAFTITKRNLGSLTGVVELCESMGVNTLNIGLVSDVGRARKNRLVDKIDEETLGKDLFLSQVHRMLKHLIAHQTRLRILTPFRLDNSQADFAEEKQYVCDGDNNQILYIMADGTIMPCDKLPVNAFACGNVRVDSVTEAWMSKKMQAFKLMGPRQLPKCQNCSLLNICGGACLARSFHAGGSLISVDWTSCAMARMFVQERQ
ncbi:MAG: radical SAM protein [Candidatus Paceibacterota bacterium]